MYAFRYLDNDPYHATMLVELTRAQVRRLGNQHTFRDVDGWCYQYCSAPDAHRWVKEGGVHGTLLYTEDGRIRRAG